MIISTALKEFHQANNLPKDGGENDSFFYIKFKPFTFKLPNPAFRRKVIHIHDIQHVLYDCDTSMERRIFYFWLGNSNRNVETFTYWAIQYQWYVCWFVFYTQRKLYNGFKEGLQCESLIDSKIPKEELLNLSISELKNRLQKEKQVKFNWFSFLFWCFASIVFISTTLIHLSWFFSMVIFL